MDVKPGHCWRCERTLPKQLLQCDRCTKAVYCSDLCWKRDVARHEAVECQIFGPKSCNYCRKEGNHKQCAGCSQAWYCNASCQKKDRTAHKEDCKYVEGSIADLALELTDEFTSIAQVDPFDPKDASSISDPPYYFGNTMACDFLQLENNEWADGLISQEQLLCDFRVLSAGCGDLRNTLLTAASLPTRYQGKLHVTLNDFDTCVMARNVLFLFMLSHESTHSDNLASSLVTIWYSLHISRKDYKLIKKSLQALMQINTGRIRELTGGLVIISDADLDKVRKIWKEWHSLQCQRIQSSSISLSEQRTASFAEDPTFYRELHLYKETLPLKEAKSIGEWIERGLFLPDKTKQSDLPFDNPTLTGVYLKTSTVRDGFLSRKTEKKWIFGYCIHPKLTPFQAWDSLRVKEHAQNSSSSITVMYHAYVEDLVQKMKTLINQGRLQIHLLVSTCLDVPNIHQSLNLVNYDRIFTSNLADHIGIRKLLQTFRPLLNVGNTNATIVTETIEWIIKTPEAYRFDLNDVHGSTEKTMKLYKRDTGNELSSPFAFNNQIEYHNNSQWFIVYLRANVMAGSLGIPRLDDIPSFKQAMQCEGMCMRDFRKDLNKLLPFQYRVNARSLSNLMGSERALEWYVPPGDF